MNTEIIRPAVLAVEDNTNFLYGVDSNNTPEVVYRILTAEGNFIMKRTEIDDTSHDITTSEYYLAVVNLTAARTLALPIDAVAGQSFIIKDASGLSATHNITIDSGGFTIDGVTDYTMSTNYESITLVFDGTSNWEVI